MHCESFHRTLAAALLLFVAALPSAGQTPPATAQLLPPVVTTDGTIAVLCLDLDQVEPSALRTAVTATLPEGSMLLLPKIKRYELMRKRLIEFGVRRIGMATGVAMGERGPSESMLLLFELRPGKRPPGFEETVLKAAMNEGMAEMQEAKVSGHWLVVYPKGKSPDFDVKPGEHAARLEAALKSLGKRPGAAIALGKPVDALIAGPIAAMQRSLPPGLAESIQAVRAAKWASLLAKIDDTPALKLELQMDDEEQAKKFAADWPARAKDLQAFLKRLPQFSPDRDKDAPPVPPGLRMIALLADTHAKQQDSQVALTLGSKHIGEVINMYALTRARALVEAADSPHMTEEVIALGDWMGIYQQVHGERPKSLDDLKPLMGETPAARDAEFKQLLTNRRTGEYPAFRYTRPAVDPPTDEELADKTPVLEELKGGKPDPNGYREYQSGRIDFGKPGKGSE